MTLGFAQVTGGRTTQPFILQISRLQFSAAKGQKLLKNLSKKMSQRVCIEFKCEDFCGYLKMAFLQHQKQRVQSVLSGEYK